VHRKSGMVFVYAMVTMAVFGMTLAVTRDKAPEINMPAGLITSYLVITSLMTVRPLAEGSRVRRPLEIGLMLVALGVGVIMLTFALEAIANGGTRNGFPAFPFFLFATFGLLGFAGDLRVLQNGVPKGPPRLARHLWRMSLALFIAALSASVQIAKFLPKPVRLPVLVIPMLAVVVTLFYWLWRVRLRRSLRGVLLVRAAEAA
jgi:hypothetical protein